MMNLNINFCVLFIYTDSNTVIELLDIPVNAVATALKDFFSKRLPPLFSKDIIKELEEVAGMYKINVSNLLVSVKNVCCFCCVGISGAQSVNFLHTYDPDVQSKT